MAILTGLQTPNTTLETVTDYITDARTLLQDTIQPYRYTDSELLTALNVALLEGRRVRADLFVFCKGGSVPTFKVNDGSEVPIEDQFRLAFLHGMVGHAIERDQEDLQDQRAIWYINVMGIILTGRNIVKTQGPSDAA
jgi:hypothetical protein